MSRLFTFGCSFTQYQWPTWADILASRFDQHENWAQSGAGNQFISNSLVECHLKNIITDRDTVAIMWTNVCRLDTYKRRRWHTPGNIFSQTYYSKDIIESLADTRGFYIRDLASMYLAQVLLDRTGCQYYMFSMVDIQNHLQYKQNLVGQEISDILPFYKNTIDKIRPSMHNVIFNYDWWSRPLLMHVEMAKLKQHYSTLAGPDWPAFENMFDPDTHKILKRKTMKELFNLNRWDWKTLFHESRRTDPHPTPLEHMEYLDKVLPEEPISQQTRTIVTQIDDYIRNEKSIDPALTRQIYKSTRPARW